MLAERCPEKRYTYRCGREYLPAHPRERLHKKDTRQRSLRTYVLGPALAACQHASRQHAKYCRGNPDDDAASNIQKRLNNPIGAAQSV